MQRRQSVLLLALLTGCAAVVDPSADRDEVRAAVAMRLDLELPEIPIDDLAPTTGAEVQRLLGEQLDEAAAVRIALLNNRDVRASFARLGVGRAELVQAARLRNPMFDLDARFLFDGGTELEFGLAQPVLDLFYRPLRTKLAEFEFEAVRAEVTHELIHLVFEVRRAFATVRASQQIVQLRQNALAAATAAHDLRVVLHAAGNATDQALAADRLGETRARLDLAAAEQAAVEAREPLNRLLGLFGRDTTWTVRGPLHELVLAELDLTGVENAAVGRSLDLAQNRAAVQAIAQRAGLQSWQSWFPDAQAGVTAIREPGGDWGLGPRLEVELPLLDDGSAVEAKLAAQLRMHLHHHHQTAVTVRAAARTLRERVTGLAARARFMREHHLPARGALLRTTLQHYNAMQIGAFEVLQQKQQQLADGGEYVSLLREASLAHLDLLELLAGSIPDNALASTWPEMAGQAAEAGGKGH